MPRRKVTSIRKPKSHDQEFELLLRRTAAKLKTKAPGAKKVSAA
jgi:hypothetical protein